MHNVVYQNKLQSCSPVYVATVLFISLVVYVITFIHCLPIPKFWAVINLSVFDVALNTSTNLSIIKLFLFKENIDLFNLCFVQMCTTSQKFGHPHSFSVFSLFLSFSKFYNTEDNEI